MATKPQMPVAVSKMGLNQMKTNLEILTEVVDSTIILIPYN